MSNNRLLLGGFDDLKAALRNLPLHLAQEASGIVTGHAESAADQIRAGYPSKTGNLRRGVKVDRSMVSGVGASARVRSTSPHAFIYENGSQIRRTDRGANRGAMPPGNVFVPIVVRERQAMVQDLIGVVQKAGLKVEGHG